MNFFVYRLLLSISAFMSIVGIDRCEDDIPESEVMYYMRMTDKDLFKIDLIQYSTLIRQVEVHQIVNTSNDTSADANRTYASANKSLWYHQDYFVYSVTDGDCWPGSNLSNYFHSKLLYNAYDKEDPITKQYPNNLTKQQIMSTSMKFTDEKIFITSTYFQVFDDLQYPKGYLNLLETRSIKYSETSLSDIKDVIVNNTNKWLRPAEPGKPWRPPHIMCVTGYYVHAYRETMYVCVNLKIDAKGKPGDVDLYVYRPLIKREYRIGMMPANYGFEFLGSTIDGNNLKMVVEPTPDKAFEMIIYYIGKKDLWILDFNREEVFNIQSFILEMDISQIDYTMRTIMIFYSGFETKRSSYYLQRNPGSRFNQTLLSLFADAKYLKTLYSNENIEIIIEMYKQFQTSDYNSPGFIAPITHLLYKFDLHKKQMGVQISTQIFSTHLHKQYYGVTYRVNSFSSLDMIVLNNAAKIHAYSTNVAVARVSIMLNMDAYSGFGSTSAMNSTYYLYPTMTEYDPFTEHYFLLPYAVKLTAGNYTQKTCDFLRHRVVRPYIQIKYDESKVNEAYNNTTKFQSNGSSLVLGLNDTKLGRFVYRFNVTFITNELTIEGTNTIWKGSNVTSFQVNPNFEQRNIDLELLVRGNFIVRVHQDAILQGKDPYPYYSASIEETNKLIEGSALFRIENYRIGKENDLYIQNVKEIYAFGRTEEKEVVEKYIIIKTDKEVQLLAYLVKDNKMKAIPPLKFASSINKIFPVAENTFIFFNLDGAMSLFYTNNFTMAPLPFPGVSCLDIELVAHIRIKPAFLCFNMNLEFTVYYIDQLIAKSLSNSLMNIEIKNSQDSSIPGINRESQMFINEFYPGKVFIYHRDAKKNMSNLSMYYLDLEEFGLMTFVNQFRVIDAKAEASGMISKIQSMQFVEDRLVVHYRVSDTANFIGVYWFEEAHDLKEIKYFAIPKTYVIPETSVLKYFHKHFQSSMYANPSKPYLLLQYLQSNTKMNVMVIDAFSPVLETVPTLLLPKNSEQCAGCEMILFNYFVSSVDRVRYYSAGLLHYSKNPLSQFRDEKKFYYLFQLIEADRPKIYFSLDKANLASYKNLFVDFKQYKVEQQRFVFNSHYAASNDEKNEVKANLKIMQKNKQVDKTSLKNRVVNVERINLKEKPTELSKNNYDSEIVMFNENFTKVPEANLFSIFDWKLEAESLFDNSVGTFQLTKPLELNKTYHAKDVSAITNVDTFCRAYRLNENTLTCTKIGWIFFHEKDVEIFYKDDIEDLEAGDSIRFPFNVDECTENVVVNHTLISVCTYNNERNIITTNLIDLSQNYTDVTSINIYARASSPRIVKTYENAFISFSKTIIDERNIKGVANTFYFMHKMEYTAKSLQKCESPLHTSLLYVYGVDSKLTDTAMGVGKVTNYSHNISKYISANQSVYENVDVYRVSGINMNAGNLVYIQIFEESNHIGPFKIPTNHSGPNFNLFERNSNGSIQIGILKVEASTEVRRVIFNKASIIDLRFNKEDAISKDIAAVKDDTNSTSDFYTEDTLFQRFCLIHFPSYHSYLYRYQRNTDLKHVSLLKLENPFAEIENKHWDNKPVCHKWACLITSTFENKSFVRVYDMRYETLSNRTKPANFKEIFTNTSTYGTNGNNEDVLSSVNDTINIDLIPAEYTIHPIQVINVTNLQLIRFDESKDNNDTLTVLIFVKPNAMRIYNLNRKSRLVSKNLYFTSAYVDLKAVSSYNMEIKYRFHVEKYTEDDFYKYIIKLVIIGAIASTLTFLYFRYLKKEQARIEQEDSQEVEMKNLLKQVLMNTKLNQGENETEEAFSKKRMSYAKDTLSAMLSKALAFKAVPSEDSPEHGNTFNFASLLANGIDLQTIIEAARETPNEQIDAKVSKKIMNDDDDSCEHEGFHN